MQVKHHGKIVKGTLTLVNKDAFKSYLSRLPDGEYEIIVRPKTILRSNAMNNYLHGVVFKIISEHTGYSLDETKTLMKEMFAPKIMLDNTEKMIPKSTAKMDNKELLTFIEQIKMHWAEREVYIPDPTEIV